MCVRHQSEKSYFKDNNISKHVVIFLRAHTFVRFHPLLSTNLLKFIGDLTVCLSEEEGGGEKERRGEGEGTGGGKRRGGEEGERRLSHDWSCFSYPTF